MPDTSAHGEHSLLKLIALYKKGEEIFGSIDEFDYWLKKPFWKSQQKPIDCLVTSEGVDFINEEIDKLAQGYPVWISDQVPDERIEDILKKYPKQ